MADQISMTSINNLMCPKTELEQALSNSKNNKVMKDAVQIKIFPLEYYLYCKKKL